MKIKLYGDVISDEWAWVYELFGVPCCYPKLVRDAIEQLPAGEDLIIEVNSPGGSAWAGFEIFGLLQSLGERTEAHIVALAASAATTITSGCSRVLASPVAQIMIHQPVIDGGVVNNNGARELQNFLDSVKASIINSYVVKCGGKTSRKKLEQLVDRSTWMPAQDAIELGLVDGLLDTSEEAAAMITAGGGIGVTNSAGGGSLESLLERYEAAVKAGTMEEVPGHPVRRESAQGAEAAAREAGKPATGEDSGDGDESAMAPAAAAGIGDLAAGVGNAVRGIDRADGVDATAFAALAVSRPDTASAYARGEAGALPTPADIVANAVEDWTLMAAIELERARGV